VEATQTETHPGPIPKYYFEQTQAKDERTNLRLVRALVLVIILFFLSNAAWLWAWVSYDYSGEETVVTQDGEGLNIYGDRNLTDFYGTDNPG
jgi:hypothetical protein